MTHTKNYVPINHKPCVHAGDKFIESLCLNLFCIISCHLCLLWLLYLISGNYALQFVNWCFLLTVGINALVNKSF